MEIKYIIGIDEVGRGPIAGPVAVCAFICPVDNCELIIKNAKEELKVPLRDSKKLSKKQREKWFKFLKEQKEKGNCDYNISFVSSENIDKFGINKCIQKSLNESLKKVVSSDIANSCVFTPEGPYADKNLRCLTSKNNLNFLLTLKGSDTDKNLEDSVSFSSYHIFLDGGLKAPVEYIHQETIIKGDELHPVISMASIIAKVSRDRVMETFAKKYPEYGFDKHVGYGTKAHYEAIKKHGQTSIHRKTFIH